MELPKPSREQLKAYQDFLNRLKKKPPKNLDYTVQETHEEVFEEINCLKCANCCKTTGPLWTEKDIERVAKHLRMKAADFELKYLRVDEDGDKVFQTLPCPFLDAENYCLIYEARPKACQEYPHTDRKKIYQISTIMLKNTEICPAVTLWFKKIKPRLP